jgi:hypothetical protein
MRVTPSRIEEASVFYACIARLMRDGGLWIIIVVRFSAVPGALRRAFVFVVLRSDRQRTLFVSQVTS